MNGDEALCERTGVEEVRSKIADNFPGLKLDSLREAAGSRTAIFVILTLLEMSSISMLKPLFSLEQLTYQV